MKQEQMIPNYNKVHLKFKLNGIHYSYEDLTEVAYSFVKEGKPFEKEIGQFLLDWLDKEDTILVNTSGSTGKPKLINIKKQAMVNSAIATGDFFKLLPGDRALHCLPTQYIAGKMMLIRAIILGLELDLVEPTSTPQLNINRAYNFCAMVPLQLQNTIRDCSHIETIIVGGAPVSNTLKTAVQNIRPSVFETYGMTETVTHIALKKLNKGETFYFETLPNVSIYQDDRDCLVIEAPRLSEESVITNDIVKIHSKSRFEWIGRYDNVINSGGIKLFPEQIEAKLKNRIEERFFIASEPHNVLGNQLILILENENKRLDESVFTDLQKYERPKKVYNIQKFVETPSGKVQRKKTLKKLNL